MSINARCLESFEWTENLDKEPLDVVVDFMQLLGPDLALKGMQHYFGIGVYVGYSYEELEIAGYRFICAPLKRSDDYPSPTDKLLRFGSDYTAAWTRYLNGIISGELTEGLFVPGLTLIFKNKEAAAMLLETELLKDTEGFPEHQIPHINATYQNSLSFSLPLLILTCYNS